jgi:cytoplasmic iron level regulating protein YaaA (DUF328/UPF0246 family)
VLILSGLWGAVAPSDRVPDYKLKMGAQLRGVGKLSAWWRDDLSAAIAGGAAGRRVWNLLPKVHVAAWAAPEELRQVTVRFLDRRPDGSLTPVSHGNKFQKGALVRHLLAHPGATPESLEDWNHPSGYRLDPGLTEHHGGTTVVSLVGPA